MSWISRHRVAAVAIAVVGLGATSLSACGQASDGQQADVVVGGIRSDDSAGAVLARASESTTEVGSGRMRIDVEVSGGSAGAGGTLSGTGSFSGSRAELTLDMGQLLGSMMPAQASGTPAFVMHEIVDGSTLYLKIDSGLPLPGLDGWTKVDGGSGAPTTGGLGVSSGPNGFLESMKGAGQSVVEVGTDTIDGAPVTIYTGTIDPEAALAASPDKAEELKGVLDQLGGSAMSFTAWIDDQGLVRRMQFEIAGDQSLGGPNLTMTMELYDLGAPVTIDLPPADQITDGGALKGLGTNGGGLLGTA
jgi:hypothetical protein